jgi:hypothetical protein
MIPAFAIVPDCSLSGAQSHVTPRWHATAAFFLGKWIAAEIVSARNLAAVHICTPRNFPTLTCCGQRIINNLQQ